MRASSMAPNQAKKVCEEMLQAQRCFQTILRSVQLYTSILGSKVGVWLCLSDLLVEHS